MSDAWHDLLGMIHVSPTNASHDQILQQHPIRKPSGLPCALTPYSGTGLSSIAQPVDGGLVDQQKGAAARIDIQVTQERIDATFQQPRLGAGMAPGHQAKATQEEETGSFPGTVTLGLP